VGEAGQRIAKAMGIQPAPAARLLRGQSGLVATMAGSSKANCRPESGRDGYVARPMGFDAKGRPDLASADLLCGRLVRISFVIGILLIEPSGCDSMVSSKPLRGIQSALICSICG